MAAIFKPKRAFWNPTRFATAFAETHVMLCEANGGGTFFGYNNGGGYGTLTDGVTGAYVDGSFIDYLRINSSNVFQMQVTGQSQVFSGASTVYCAFEGFNGDASFGMSWTGTTYNYTSSELYSFLQANEDEYLDLILSEAA